MPRISKFATPAACGLALTLALAIIQPAVAEEIKHFITRQGDKLMDGDREYRFISVNIPNLLVIEDAFGFTKPTPWRWPDEYELEDALESVRQMGGQVARTYVISVYREGSDMGETVHVRAPGEFNEEGFKALDKALEIARRKGIRLMIPFVDKAKWMGGVPQYAGFRGKTDKDFWTDPEIIADFKKTVEYVLNRKNTYTGVAYKDDPTIVGWETGNEIDATADWTREIAAYLKQLDPNHIVIDGRSLHGVSPWQLEDPNVDVITTHHYPHAGNSDFVPAIRAAHAQTKGKLPYVIGEFGFLETPGLQAVNDVAIKEGMTGTLIWSLRFHSRDGGFYWHWEPGLGGNRYKAYHWPGFESGSTYDERAVMALTRSDGFKIRGLAEPPLEAPAAPHLLAIEHPSAISWQGSTGAASYNVERAPSREGQWTTVGDDITDADTQYRPLFHDDSAKPGESYFYRVVASNSGGDSKPSNVVGPVKSDYRTLVDECQDLSRVEKSAGVEPRSENARRTQEDCHRLAMSPGAEVVYHVDGPIRAWRVYSFAESENGSLAISISADGKNFTPIDAGRQSYASGKNDYGYMTPILFQGKASGAPQSFLKIALSPQSAGAGDKPPVQLSRVEIDYAE